MKFKCVWNVLKYGTLAVSAGLLDSVGNLSTGVYCIIKHIEQNIVDLLINYSSREYENWLFHKYFQKYVCTKYSSTTLVLMQM